MHCFYCYSSYFSSILLLGLICEDVFMFMLNSKLIYNKLSILKVHLHCVLNDGQSFSGLKILRYATVPFFTEFFYYDCGLLISIYQRSFQIKSYYGISRNLLVKFKDDAIDETSTLAQVLSSDSAISSKLDMSIRLLPGDHGLPLQQVIFLPNT